MGFLAFGGILRLQVASLREDYLSKGLLTTDLISPNPRVKFFYVKDPAGVRVQFVEG